MVESITIDTSGENEGPSLEEQAAAMDVKEAENAPEQERPEWLPEKFSSAEELAKAYSELEKAQSSRKQERNLTEFDPENVPDEQEAAQIAEEAGLDFYELSATFWSQGDLTPEQYEALEASGIPRDIVDSYIDSQLDNLEHQREAIMNEVSEGTSYDELTEWAVTNLEANEINAYNRIMQSNDVDAIRMAVRGLNARYNSEYGVEPKRNLSGSEASMGETYGSVAQLTQDMSDPRYESDPAFRAKVEAKLGRSNIL